MDSNNVLTSIYIIINTYITFVIAEAFNNKLVNNIDGGPVGVCTVTNPGNVVFLIDSKDCSVYYICNWGKPIRMQCPTNLYFNPTLNVCDWPKNVECEASLAKEAYDTSAKNILSKKNITSAKQKSTSITIDNLILKEAALIDTGRIRPRKERKAAQEYTEAEKSITTTTIFNTEFITQRPDVRKNYSQVMETLPLDDNAENKRDILTEINIKDKVEISSGTITDNSTVMQHFRMVTDNSIMTDHLHTKELEVTTEDITTIKNSTFEVTTSSAIRNIEETEESIKIQTNTIEELTTVKMQEISSLPEPISSVKLSAINKSNTTIELINLLESTSTEEAVVYKEATQEDISPEVITLAEQYASLENSTTASITISILEPKLKTKSYVIEEPLTTKILSLENNRMTEELQSTEDNIEETTILRLTAINEYIERKESSDNRQFPITHNIVTEQALELSNDSTTIEKSNSMEVVTSTEEAIPPEDSIIAQSSAIPQSLQVIQNIILPIPTIQLESVQQPKIDQSKSNKEFTNIEEGTAVTEFLRIQNSRSEINNSKIEQIAMYAFTEELITLQEKSTERDDFGMKETISERSVAIEEPSVLQKPIAISEVATTNQLVTTEELTTIQLLKITTQRHTTIGESPATTDQSIIIENPAIELTRIREPTTTPLATTRQFTTTEDFLKTQESAKTNRSVKAENFDTTMQEPTITEQKSMTTETPEYFSTTQTFTTSQYLTTKVMQVPTIIQPATAEQPIIDSIRIQNDTSAMNLIKTGDTSVETFTEEQITILQEQSTDDDYTNMEQPASEKSTTMRESTTPHQRITIIQESTSIEKKNLTATEEEIKIQRLTTIGEPTTTEEFIITEDPKAELLAAQKEAITTEAGTIRQQLTKTEESLKTDQRATTTQEPTTTDRLTTHQKSRTMHLDNEDGLSEEVQLATIYKPTIEQIPLMDEILIEQTVDKLNSIEVVTPADEAIPSEDFVTAQIPAIPQYLKAMEKEVSQIPTIQLESVQQPKIDQSMSSKGFPNIDYETATEFIRIQNNASEVNVSITEQITTVETFTEKLITLQEQSTEKDDIGMQESVSQRLNAIDKPSVIQQPIDITQESTSIAEAAITDQFATIKEFATTQLLTISTQRPTTIGESTTITENTTTEQASEESAITEEPTTQQRITATQRSVTALESFTTKQLTATGEEVRTTQQLTTTGEHTTTEQSIIAEESKTELLAAQEIITSQAAIIRKTTTEESLKTEQRATTTEEPERPTTQQKFSTIHLDNEPGLWEENITRILDISKYITTKIEEVQPATIDEPIIWQSDAISKFTDMDEATTTAEYNRIQKNTSVSFVNEAQAIIPQEESTEKVTVAQTLTSEMSSRTETSTVQQQIIAKEEIATTVESTLTQPLATTTTQQPISTGELTVEHIITTELTTTIKEPITLEESTTTGKSVATDHLAATIQKPLTIKELATVEKEHITKEPIMNSNDEVFLSKQTVTTKMSSKSPEDFHDIDEETTTIEPVKMQKHISYEQSQKEYHTELSEDITVKSRVSTKERINEDTVSQVPTVTPKSAILTELTSTKPIVTKNNVLEFNGIEQSSLEEPKSTENFINTESHTIQEFTFPKVGVITEVPTILQIPTIRKQVSTSDEDITIEESRALELTTPIVDTATVQYYTTMQSTTIQQDTSTEEPPLATDITVTQTHTIKEQVPIWDEYVKKDESATTNHFLTYQDISVPHTTTGQSILVKQMVPTTIEIGIIEITEPVTTYASTTIWQPNTKQELAIIEQKILREEAITMSTSSPNELSVKEKFKPTKSVENWESIQEKNIKSREETTLIRTPIITKLPNVSLTSGAANHMNQEHDESEEYIRTQNLPTVLLTTIKEIAKQASSTLVKRKILRLDKLQGGPSGECPKLNGAHVLFLPDSLDCNIFYVCDWGKPVLMHCPTSLRFNPTFNICDWPHNVHCKTDSLLSLIVKQHSEMPKGTTPVEISTTRQEILGKLIETPRSTVMKMNLSTAAPEFTKNEDTFIGTQDTLQRNPTKEVSTTERITTSITLEESLVNAAATKEQISAVGQNYTDEINMASDAYTVNDRYLTTETPVKAEKIIEAETSSVVQIGRVTTEKYFITESSMTTEENIAIRTSADIAEASTIQNHITKDFIKIKKNPRIRRSSTPKDLFKDQYTTIGNDKIAQVDTIMQAEAPTTKVIVTEKLPVLTRKDLKPKPILKCPRSNGMNNIFVPDNEECATYYMCNWGTPMQMKCPSGLHFNPTLNICDWPANAGCVVGSS